MISRTLKSEKHWLRELTLKEEKTGLKIENWKAMDWDIHPVIEQENTEELWCCIGLWKSMEGILDKV